MAWLYRGGDFGRSASNAAVHTDPSKLAPPCHAGTVYGMDAVHEPPGTGSRRVPAWHGGASQHGTKNSR